MKNLIRLIEILFAENARFFYYHVRIFELKIGDMSNMIWDARYNIIKIIAAQTKFLNISYILIVIYDVRTGP